MNQENPMLEDAAKMYDSWRKRVATALVAPADDLRWTENPDSIRAIAKALKSSGVSEEAVQLLVDEIVRGICISMFSILDGATKMSENHELKIEIDGQPIGLGSLHLDFVTHLLDTNRMK